MISRSVSVGSFLLCLAVTLASCAEQPKKTATRVLEIEKGGGQTVQLVVEIADTGESRERGLMFREKLSDGEGMIFVFDYDQNLSFWMKNTLIPLSIAFIGSDGRIQDIHDMAPRELRPVPSERAARYALEVPQGWFARAGIAVGNRLLLEGFKNDNQKPAASSGQ